MPSLNKKRPAIRRSRASFVLFCSVIAGYASVSAVIPDIPPLRCEEKTLLFVIFLDLLDDVGRRAAIFKVEHQHLAAVCPDFFATGDLFRLIVAAFYQQIRQNSGNQPLRGILFKRDHPIDGFQRAQHDHPLIQRVDRARVAFQTPG